MRVRHPWHEQVTEIIAASLLALATVASAWSAYQAARWSGIETFRLAHAAREDRLAEASHLDQFEYRLLDTVQFTRFLAARVDGDDRLAELIHSQFRPEMRRAVDAWLALDPLNNAEAPASPFEMPEYRRELDAAAEAARGASDARLQSAHLANRTSDNYVFSTVLLASVLFFAGITSKFYSLKMRITMLAMGAVLFVASLALLLSFPKA